MGLARGRLTPCEARELSGGARRAGEGSRGVPGAPGGLWGLCGASLLVCVEDASRVGERFGGG